MTDERFLTVQLDADGDLPVWQVVFANYEPPEVDSTWLHHPDAQRRAEYLERKSGFDWRVKQAWVMGQGRSVSDDDAPGLVDGS
jgi:hypothetical protein